MSENEKYCLNLVKCECDKPKLLDLSYEEQYAGFHDENGDKVYVRSVNLGNLPTPNTIKNVPHGIENIKTLVAESIRQDYRNTGDQIGRCGSVTYGSNCVAFSLHKDYVTIATLTWDLSSYSAIATYYYTCTDR